MEPDRYAQNHSHYILGLLCLFSGIGLFAFTLYLLPYLFFNWHYGVPGFITHFSAMLEDHYLITSSGTAWVISLGLFLPTVILFIVADVMSNRIDSKIHGISSRPSREIKAEPSSTEPAQNSETKNLVLKIVLSMVVIFVVAQIFHWVISSS